MIPIIKTENLSKAFGANKVLDNINMELPEKKLSAIIGQSGT
jgi:ABC-type transporter Mla maintaining outer membrane lipid asymmetry ATPase subunit MlaF